MKYGFTPPHPVVQDLCNGIWVIWEPLFYDGPDGRYWTIPKGFRTDFGSVPDLVDWIIPAMASIADPAYVLHDYLYWLHRNGQDGCVDRADADQILLDALKVCGVSCVKRYTIYWAVRAGGWVAWSGKPDKWE
jgi:hypothetical protein